MSLLHCYDLILSQIGFVKSIYIGGSKEHIDGRARCRYKWIVAQRSLLIVAVTVLGLGSTAAEAGRGSRFEPAMVRTAERLRAPGASHVAARREALSREEITARQIERLLAGPLRRGTTSVFIADASTGERLFAVNPDTRLNAASNVKLIATAAALDLLGPEYRYPTYVLGEPPDDAGAVSRDLYLLGSYDPTLGRAGLADLASQIAARGVTRLDGDIVVGEAPSRDGVFRSFVELSVTATKPGEAVAVAMSPPNDLVQLRITARTAAKRRARAGLTTSIEPIVDDSGRRRMRITVSGQLGRGRSAKRTVWLGERALLAAHLLREELRKAGVEVNGDAHISSLRDYVDASLARGFLPIPVAEHRSETLARIVGDINKRSTNWLADRIIMTAAARRYGGAPSMEKAITAMYAWLTRRTGLDRDDLVVDSGSGLSYRTKISSRQIVHVVRAAMGMPPSSPGEAARNAPRWKAYRDSLAVGGADGTLRHRFVDLDGEVLGKTGTLRQVVALSGILEVAPDRRVVFSLITNGHAPRRRHAVRHAQDQLVELLVQYLRGRGGVPDPAAHRRPRPGPKD